jgi:flagellar protein FlaG
MKPLDAIGSLDVSSIQQVEGHPPRDWGKSAEDAVPEKVDQDRDKVGQEKAAERDRTQKVVDRLNRMGHIFNRRIRFEIPSDSEDVIVKIIDQETGQVIRQIPPPELVKLAKHMDEIYEFIFRSKLS